MNTVAHDTHKPQYSKNLVSKSLLSRRIRPHLYLAIDFIIHVSFQNSCCIWQSVSSFIQLMHLDAVFTDYHHLIHITKLDEQKLEVAMMIGVVQKRLLQSMRVNEMPLEKGWGWEPRKRRYAASGAICENELADGFGLEPFGHLTESEEEDDENRREESLGTSERYDQAGGVGDRTLTAESESAKKPYVHAGDITPLQEAMPETLYRIAELSPIRPQTQESRARTAAERDALPGRAWLEIGGHNIECTKATFGEFKLLRASVRWAQPAEANAPLANGEEINGCAAVVKRDAPNLQEKLGSLAEKVDRCVMAGAVAVIVVNTGRGYELIAPEDPLGLSAAWPSGHQVPIVCIRDMDAAALQDGVDCSFQRRSNSPTPTSPAHTVGSAVRFKANEIVPQSLRWETLEADGERDGESSKARSPLARALSIASGQGSAMAKQAAAGVRGLRRLSMGIRYKLMPAFGLSSLALNAGMQDAEVVDENVGISPLSRHNKETPGVFKRTSSLNPFERAASAASQSTFARRLSSAALAVVGQAQTSSQNFRVAQDLVHEDTDALERVRQRDLGNAESRGASASFRSSSKGQSSPQSPRFLRSPFSRPCVSSSFA